MVEGIEIYPKDIKKNGNFGSQNEDDYFFNWWGGNLRGVADNPIDLGNRQTSWFIPLMITVRQSMSSRGSKAAIHMILFIRTAGMITGSIFRTKI